MGSRKYIGLGSGTAQLCCGWGTQGIGTPCIYHFLTSTKKFTFFKFLALYNMAYAFLAVGKQGVGVNKNISEMLNAQMSLLIR